MQEDPENHERRGPIHSRIGAMLFHHNPRPPYARWTIEKHRVRILGETTNVRDELFPGSTLQLRMKKVLKNPRRADPFMAVCLSNNPNLPRSVFPCLHFLICPAVNNDTS